MNPSSPLPIRNDVPRSAEEWLARLLSPDCTGDDYTSFEDWLAMSPDNAIAYAEAEHLHAIAGVAAKDMEALPRTASQPSPDSRRRKRRLPSLALAATVLAAIGFAAWIQPWGRTGDASTYATNIGEQRTLTLSDGTSLVLDTDTRVSVSYQGARRRIELEQGRLHVDVAHDPSRPFEVVSGIGVTRALGTVFQVEEVHGTTFVRLIEGRVSVGTLHTDSGATREMQPLQSVSYGSDGEISQPQGIDPDTANGWLRGKLVFKDRALSDLVYEFNRYSNDKITIEDSTLAGIRISGVFDARDQAGLITSLRQGWGIHAVRTREHEISLSSKNE